MTKKKLRKELATAKADAEYRAKMIERLNDRLTVADKMFAVLRQVVGPEPVQAVTRSGPENVPQPITLRDGVWHPRPKIGASAPWWIAP